MTARAHQTGKSLESTERPPEQPRDRRVGARGPQARGEVLAGGGRVCCTSPGRMPGKEVYQFAVFAGISETHVVWKPVSPPTCDLPVPVTMSGEAPHGPARGIQAPPSAPQGRAGLTTWQILVQKKTVP